MSPMTLPSAPSSTARAVFLDADTLPLGTELHEALAGRIDYQAFAHTPPADVVPRLAGARVAIVNKVRLTGEVLAQLPALKRICVSAAGTDNVDLMAARALGIGVFNVPDYGSDSVAEHVVATLLALRRQLFAYADAARDGRWSASSHFCWHGPRIRDVGGSLMGVVGRGRIGEATGRLARGLGMRVLFAARAGRALAEDERPLDELLAQADALSLHLPLTADTRGLIDARRLALMKPTSVLINTGRGALVDAPALAEALCAGRIAGAAIDVLDVEPPPATHPLLAQGIPNLLLTPHSAWASESAQRRLAERLVALVLEEVALA